MSKKRCVTICIFTFLILFLVTFSIADKTKIEYENVQKAEPLVFVTLNGECYHSMDCHYLNKSSKGIGLYKAISEGFRACSHCGGDISGIVMVEYLQPYEQDNTLFAFLLCIGLSIALASCFYVTLSIIHFNTKSPPKR